MSDNLFCPITLPSGQVLPNVIVKAAMEENMAEVNQLPGRSLYRLYQQWAKDGPGLLITGNVMVDPLALTGPGGVVLTKDSPVEPFQQWSSSVHQQGGKIMMQINHPGRQVFANMGGRVWSPSDVRLSMGKHTERFGQPTPMTEAQIQETIRRFEETAVKAKEAGFDGVQIHAAHGYLLAQFLSPRTNKRDDQWGGSLANRARLLLTIVERVRHAVGAQFMVSVKLNSADFQHGGFTLDDAKQVVEWLNDQQLDFVELSGGSYESPAMQGRTADDSTMAREAFFLDMAKQVRDIAKMPLMTTGGIRRVETAQLVKDSGIELVGVASAFAMASDLVTQWQQATPAPILIPVVTWKDKTLKGLTTMAMMRRQLQRMGRGKSPLATPSPLWTLIRDQWRLARLTRRYHQYRSQLDMRF